MTAAPNQPPKAKDLGVASPLRPPPRALDEPEAGSSEDPFAPPDACACR
jgi:hypothetical protein